MAGLSPINLQDIALFPTQVRILRWQTGKGFNERLSDMCAELFESAIKGKQPYHTYNLWRYEFPEFAELRRMFEQAMRAYIEAHMNPRIVEHHDYRMHAWLRIDDPKEVIAPHTHPDVHVVGTYYSRVEIAVRKRAAPPPGRGSDGRKDMEGDLVLLDPRPGVKLGFEKSREATYAITPEVGMMVLIPCFLGHWVNPVSEGDRRICIANNMTLSRRAPIGVSGSFRSGRLASCVGQAGASSKLADSQV